MHNGTEIEHLEGSMITLKHRKMRGFGASTSSNHRKIRYLMQNVIELQGIPMIP